MNAAAPCQRCGGEMIEPSARGLCPPCAGAEAVAIQRTMVIDMSDLPEETASTLLRFGDYELLEEIARGGMGVVYKARQLSLHRIVAVKMILNARFNNPEVVGRFHAEAEAAANLHHPNIVAIYDIGVEEGQHYFSMEFIEGRNLASLVRDQPLPARRAAEYMKTVAEAVHHAHRHGILHRDLKPSNVMIDAEGSLRVMDFGLAKRINENPADEASASGGSTDLTLSGQVLGSPSFMSPEQAAGRSRQVTAGSDVYSLGAMLYQLVTARAPFMAETVEATLMQVLQTDPPRPRLLNPTVPRDIETICLKCLEKDPARRYGSAEELAEELGRFLRGEPVLARPVSRLERIGRWCRRHPVESSLAAATVLLVLSIAIGSPIAALRIDRARRESVKNADESRERLRRFHVAGGVAAMDAGDHLGALPWLIKALQMEVPGSEGEQLARLRLGAVLEHAPRIVEFWSLGEPARSVEFGPTGRHLVVTTESEQAFVASKTNGWKLVPFGAPQEKIPRVAFSSDGEHLALGSRSNRVYLLNVQTLPATVTVIPVSRPPKEIRFTPDGRRLFVAWNDGVMQVCDATTGTSLGESWTTGEKLVRLKFNADGSRFLLMGEERVTVYETETRRKLMPNIEHTDLITDAKFSPDGKFILTSSRDSTAKLSWFPTGPVLDSSEWRTVILPHAGEDIWVTGADVSADGRLVATATNFRRAYIWDTRTGLPATPPLIHGHSIFKIHFSPDGRHVATASFDATARIWDTATGEPVTSSLRHNGFVVDAIFSPDGSRLLTAGQDGAVRLWEFESRVLRWKAEGLLPSLICALSPDGTVIATGDTNGGVTLRARDTGRVFATAQHAREISAIEFSPSGRVFATAARDGTVTLRSVTNAAPLLPAWEMQRPVVSMAFSPKGDRLLAGGESRTAEIWNTATGERIGEPLRHTRSVRSVQFSPDGALVATGSSDNNAQLWEATTGRAVGPPLIHDSGVVRVLFSPDGRTLATAVSDTSFAARAAHLWDVASQKETVPPMSHSDGVECLAFSADGRRLATGSEDGTVYVWDTATGQRRTPAMRHDHQVYAVEFVSGDRALFTAGRDGVGRLWDAVMGEPLTVRVPMPKMLSTGAVTKDGRHIFWSGNDGRMMLYSFAAETRDLDQLTALAELLTSRRLDQGAGLTPASVESMTRNWAQYRAPADDKR